ncbi:hypothetical protein KEM48_012882 [Puccinia striiformis f. sp. tritici PST-130]|nr:hypothetical protein KEM48_012882 [Puccinia striiformis f. sp. tritici PST-130]
MSSAASSPTPNNLLPLKDLSVTSPLITPPRSYPNLAWKGGHLNQTTTVPSFTSVRTTVRNSVSKSSAESCATNSGTHPAAQLVLTRHIPTPTNVFDTNEEERSSETAGHPSPDPTEASVLTNIAPVEEIHGPIPHIFDLIAIARNQALQGADNPHGLLALRPTTLQDRLRLAHGRLNMLQHQFSPIPTSLSDWEESNCKAKSATIKKRAYANAILSRDAELFDGINTLSMIPEAERRMPTYDEVMNQLQFIVHTELDDILGSDG